jgi:hypothetical protein
MAGNISELDLEKRVRSIENDTITDIWYQQMDEEADGYDKEFHSIDTAVYMKTGKNKIFKMSWADEFGLYHGFGISLKEIKIIDKDTGFFTEMTQDKNYQTIIGKKIASARVHWQDVIDNMRGDRIPILGMGYIRRRDYPQTVEINFEDGLQMFGSAMKIQDDGKCIPFTNHLTIFFYQTVIDRYYKPLRKW